MKLNTLLKILYKKEMDETKQRWFSTYKSAWLLLAFGLLSSIAGAQTVTQTTPSGTFYTYTVPVGVTQIMVETWGGGGAGAGRTSNGDGAGGAGGGYARKIITVNPGDTYYFNVGAGATGSTGSPARGASSWFSTTTSDGGSTLVRAGGGNSAAANATTATSWSTPSPAQVGDVTYNGGNGGATATGRGGHGGSSAGMDAAGNAGGTGSSPAAAPYGGGIGAAGQTTNGTAGNSATEVGGGGSGARRNGTNVAGGSGANGKVSISAILTGWGSGSRDLFPTNAQGRRTVLFSHTGPLYDQGMPYMNRGINKVYAVAGEKIYIGSSTQGSISNSAQNGSTSKSTDDVPAEAKGGAIRVYKPSTKPNASRSNYDYWSGSSSTVGKIVNRSEELLGPKIENFKTSGYTPFSFEAPETGVYEIEFLSPAAGNTSVTGSSTPTGLLTSGSDGATVSWTQSTASNVTSVVAWDITVAESDGTIKPGRVYMNVFNGGHQFDFTNGTFYGKFYVVTKDGFPYYVENNGMTGGYFTFLVNNRGFTTQSNGAGNRTYLSQNNVPVTNVYNIKNPNEPDDALNTTHKIFYGMPNADLPAKAVYNGSGVADTTWLKYPNPPDPTAEDIKFVGVEGSDGYGGSKGAYIEFDSNVAGTYRITIPGDPGNSTPYYDRVLTGGSNTGHNKIYWDGKTGKQTDATEPDILLPPGAAIGTIEVQLTGAEVHFPYIDMEGNTKGIKIIQLDKNTYAYPTTIGDKDLVWWDDVNVTPGGTGTVASPKTVAISSSGEHSSTNGHKYGGTGTTGYGDQKGIDTYSFVPGPISELTGVTVEIKVADLAVTAFTSSLPATPVNIGDTYAYSATVKNIGPQPIQTNRDSGAGFLTEPARFNLYLPYGVSVNPSAVTFNSSTGVTIEPTSPAPSFTSDPSTGGVYTAYINMPVNGEATFTLPAEIVAAIAQTGNGNINAYATILRPKDFSDPNATNPDLATTTPDDPFYEADGVGIHASSTIFTNPSAVTAGITADPLNPTAGKTNNIKNVNTPIMLADLQITKTAKQSNTANGVGSFTITVTNAGSSIATGVVVTDVLSSRYTYTGSSASTGTVNYTGGAAGTVTWTIGTIPVNGTETLTFNTTNVGSTNRSNTATVVGEQYDPATGNNSSTIDVGVTTSPTTDLRVVKLVNGAPTASVLVGSVVTFKITVNRVSGSDVNNVIVKDLLPTGFTLTGTPVASQGTFNSTTGIWTVGTINSSADRTLTITAVVKPSTGTPNEYTNVATITGTDNLDDDASNNSSQAVITVGSMLITNPMIYQRIKNE